MRELYSLTEKRIQYDWQRTSAQLATIINCNLTRDSEPLRLDAFVPKTSVQKEKKQKSDVIDDPAMYPILKDFLKKLFPKLNPD